MALIESTELKKRLQEYPNLSVRDFTTVVRAIKTMEEEQEGKKACKEYAKQNFDLKEFAKNLNGIEYGYPQFPKEYIEYAKEHKLVIVAGASDDLCELDGAIFDEFDCFEGGKISFAYADGTISFRANWCDTIECDINDHVGFEQVPWSYSEPSFIPNPSSNDVSVSIPYETFWLLEGGGLYCRGMVFELPKREV